MGLFDKFKKKDKNVAAPDSPQSEPTSDALPTAPVSDNQAVAVAVSPDSNPFVENFAPTPEVAETQSAPVATFDNMFNAAPGDLIMPPSSPAIEAVTPDMQIQNVEVNDEGQVVAEQVPEADFSEVTPIVEETAALIDNPEPIVEQQIALNVNPEEMFEGGDTKEDAITQIVSENVQKEENPAPQVNVEDPSLSSVQVADQVMEQVVDKVVEQITQQVENVSENSTTETTASEQAVAESTEQPIEQNVVEEVIPTSVSSVEEPVVEDTIEFNENITGPVEQPTNIIENIAENPASDTIASEQMIIEPTEQVAVEDSSLNLEASVEEPISSIIESSAVSDTEQTPAEEPEPVIELTPTETENVTEIVDNTPTEEPITEINNSEQPIEQPTVEESNSTPEVPVEEVVSEVSDEVSENATELPEQVAGVAEYENIAEQPVESSATTVVEIVNNNQGETNQTIESPEQENIINNAEPVVEDISVAEAENNPEIINQSTEENAKITEVTENVTDNLTETAQPVDQVIENPEVEEVTVENPESNPSLENTSSISQVTADLMSELEEEQKNNESVPAGTEAIEDIIPSDPIIPQEIAESQNGIVELTSDLSNDTESTEFQEEAPITEISNSGVSEIGQPIIASENKDDAIQNRIDSAEDIESSSVLPEEGKNIVSEENPSEPIVESEENVEEISQENPTSIKTEDPNFSNEETKEETESPTEEVPGPIISEVEPEINPVIEKGEEDKTSFAEINKKADIEERIALPEIKRKESPKEESKESISETEPVVSPIIEEKTEDIIAPIIEESNPSLNVPIISETEEEIIINPDSSNNPVILDQEEDIKLPPQEVNNTSAEDLSKESPIVEFPHIEMPSVEQPTNKNTSFTGLQPPIPTVVQTPESENGTYISEQPSQTKFCNNCGIMLTDDYSICPSCGEPID